ncbi:MAG: O-antigen ligase family protein [Candidatus Pedobacter colombiensis]|uniref:O-antigen ligase family protein n=1 Tax=Candidatus Pedobacter colombiensis TaxID=3121371 RepID=A0AAJ5WC32_9SPHI|nr:O-antigen ligase family protein [Pedobacter sp.]WEK21283.1 MAG: O-antigen ligase family protein [Pedobacter sp.]
MKFITVVFMILYLYALSFGVFFTEFFRIPAPILFGFPLVFVFKEVGSSFMYVKEILIFSLAFFFYYIVGVDDYKLFTVNITSILICALYFSYFVGPNSERFRLSILIFFSLLAFSATVMVLNHFNESYINSLRGLLAGQEVIQSPSGIAAYQFTFGYQLAALTPFIFIYAYLFKKRWLIKALALSICLIFIFLGMQRSVFVGFIGSVLIFLLIYYKYKAVYIIGIAVLASILLYTYVLKDSFDSKGRGAENIMVKNEQDDGEYNRSILLKENLRIYSEYPYGLIFYGKNWGDVIYRNQVFRSGITSHNAYVMFFTYLGPFLGFGLLIALYYKIIGAFKSILNHAREKKYALLICLILSFLAVTINSLSHNAWLLSADGPTVFLFFSILHYLKIQKNNKHLEETENVRNNHPEVHINWKMNGELEDRILI